MISLVNKSHRYLKFNSAIYSQISKQSTSGAGKSDDEIFKTDATDKTDLKDEKFDDAPLSPQYEEQVEKEITFKNKVEAMRNVSRFSKPGLYNKYLKNPIKLTEEALKNTKYLRRIYAQHGEKSGIEPGIAWPHKAELEKILKEEQEYDLTLEQKIKMFIERKNSEIQEYQKLFVLNNFIYLYFLRFFNFFISFRESAADKNLEKQPKQIEQYYQRLQKKYQTLAQQSKKKEELLEKAREYYGFDVDIRDTRYLFILYS